MFLCVSRCMQVPCTKFLCALQTPGGSAVLFMLLFPEYPPKGESPPDLYLASVTLGLYAEIFSLCTLLLVCIITLLY